MNKVHHSAGLCRTTCPILNPGFLSKSRDCPFGVVTHWMTGFLYVLIVPLLGLITRVQGEDRKWEHLSECDLPGDGVKKKPPFFPLPLVALPFHLKTILRIITFIMSFIMETSSCLKINAGLQNYIWYMEVVCM